MLIVLSKFVHTGRGRAESISLCVRPKDSSRTTAHTTTLLHFESALMFFRWYVIAKYFPLCNFLSSFLSCVLVCLKIEIGPTEQIQHTPAWFHPFMTSQVFHENFLVWFFWLFDCCQLLAKSSAKKKAKKPFNDNVHDVYNFGLSQPLSGCELSKWRKRPRMWKISKKYHIISGRPENDDDSDYMSHGEWRVANFTQLRYYTHMKLISRKIDKLQSFRIITWHAIFYDYAFCCNHPDELN